MFCSNCGKQIEDGAAFCSGCGTSLNSQVQPPVQQQAVYQQPINQQPVHQQVSGKPATKKGRTVGIVLLVLGVLSFLGMNANGTIETLSVEGAGPEDIVTILLIVGFIIGGVYLIIKNKKQ